MMEKISALYSQYIIDGIPQDITPGQMLDECLAVKANREPAPCPGTTLLDETTDPKPGLIELDSWKIRDYLESTLAAPPHGIPAMFASQYSRIAILRALCEALWKEGHFRLCDLALAMEWHWDMESIGGSAAFYASVHSVTEYLSSLSLKLSSYDFHESGKCSIDIRAEVLNPSAEEDDFPIELPYKSAHPTFLERRRVPAQIIDDPESWLIFVPVEGFEFRLGGSLLAGLTGEGGGIAPNPSDPDYFIDCYEVLREMVEDDIILSAATVGDGGILTALKRMTAGGTAGARINLSGIMSAYREQDLVRILFSEVPGVIIQIRDIDFDYLDAELVLQDVAFFPLGHPVHGRTEIKVDSSAPSGIQDILESLIRSQSSEGED